MRCVVLCAYARKNSDARTIGGSVGIPSRLLASGTVERGLSYAPYTRYAGNFEQAKGFLERHKTSTSKWFFGPLISEDRTSVTRRARSEAVGELFVV